MHQSSARQRGLLETKILTLAKTIIFITLCIVVAIVVVQVVVRKQAWELVVVRSLSLTIASVPVALPLVMQIMMTVSEWPGELVFGILRASGGQSEVSCIRGSLQLDESQGR